MAVKPSTMLNSLPFTVKEGLEIQAKHLAFWKAILKPEYYNQLKAEADKRNAKGYSSGYDVFRGTDLVNFVMNILND